MSSKLDQNGPKRLCDGGDASSQGQRAAGLLRRARLGPPAPPTLADRERAWAGLQARRASGRGRLLRTAAAPLAACAAAALLVWMLRPVAPPPSSLPSPSATALPGFTVTLAAGSVRAGSAFSPLAPVVAGAELPSGSRLLTEAKSRAHVRFFDDSGLLVREGTEVALAQRAEGAVVHVSSGAVVAQVSPQPAGRTFAVIARDVRIDVVGTLFSVESGGSAVLVRVSEGAVSVQQVGSSARVEAGHCWSSATRAVVRCPGPADAGLARGLTRPKANEGRVVIEGEPGLDVSADGLELGHPPIQWWTAARSLSVSGQGGGGERVERSVSVEASREVRVALAVGQPRPAAVAAALEPGAETEEIPTARRQRSSRPGGDPAKAASSEANPPGPIFAPPTPAPEPPAAADPGSLYQQALRLEREGRFAAAAGILEELSARSDRFGEQSLYELGRVRYRSLGDPAGALAAFDSYRQRFGSGTFRPEVDLSAVDAALASGDSRRARAEADTFLATHPRSERERSVRRIRADLLREAGDCAAAARDYRRLLEEDPHGPDADDHAWYVALCEARQGNAARARELLETYLSRFPGGRHRAEALKALEPPGK